jgi:glutathione S-transferase
VDDVAQLGPDQQHAAPHLARRPFGQIPAFTDGDAALFESGDILVIAVLRMVRHTDLVSEFPVLVAYQARREARPAFKRALDDHMAAFAKYDGSA